MSTADALTTISKDVYAARESFDLARIDSSWNFEREAGFAMQQLSRNDYTMKVATASRQSVYDAMVNVAAIGISLNPAKKQAYLVPRAGRICLDVSYMGLMDLAMATGSLKWAQAALVCEADTFALNGFDKPPTHTFNPFSTDRGPIIGVYVTVKTADGEYLTHTMTAGDAYAIRDRSEAWKAGKSGPWKTDEGEMIKKTCVKQAYKYWPKTERIETAIHHLDTEGGEGLAVLASEKHTGLKIAALDGIGDDLPTQTKQILEAVANSIIDHFNNDDLIGAYGDYIGVRDNPEYDDGKLWMWKKLPSNIRSALKKHGTSLGEAA